MCSCAGLNTAAALQFMTMLKTDEWDYSNWEYSLLQDTTAEVSLQTATPQTLGRQEGDMD